MGWAVHDGLLDGKGLHDPSSVHINISLLRQLDPTESSLLMTEPYFNLPNLQDVYDQFIFEEYEFQSYYRCTRTWYWYMTET